MDTQGPTSVLDSGNRNRDHLVRDRITRQKSPSRTLKSHHHSREEDDSEDIVYRIPQPYRTSFSACKSVERGKKDRSRSLSPTSSLYSDHSLLSERSSRMNRNRSKSPKRVTYASKVIVRHSDTEDSMLTELSSQDLEKTPQSHKYPVSPIAGRANVSTLSKDSGLDSSPFLDLSSQLLKPTRSPSTEMDKPTSILRDTQNSRQMSPPSSPLDQQSSSSTSPTSPSPAQVGPDNKENSPTRNGGHKPNSPGTQRTVSKDYQHDRTISYRMAVQDPEHAKQQGGGVGDRDSWDQSKLDKDAAGMREERSNTMPTTPHPVPPSSGQLTPSKKSVSGSISNFFRRISPRMGRKPAKERKCHSAGGSAQSLSGADSLTPDSDAPSGTSSHGGNFSRNRVRESFNKLFKRPKNKNKASEPSLLSGTSQTSQGSKQAVISQDLAQSQSDSSSGPSPPRPLQTPHPLPGSRENALSPLGGSGGDLPPFSPSSLSEGSSSGGGGLLSPQDPTARKPSYLKIACAVSGYGRYSQYTSYRDIERRSPFSSTSSLPRSGLSTPEMPAVRSPGAEALRAAAALASGQCGGGGGGGGLPPLLNGHGQPAYPTGDTLKDGEYFLQLTQMEEERLQAACTKAESEAATSSLPEEACGKIRAAIGKCNLLISQKFQQFRDLCSQHMHPESSEKLTKWEDLQGFWDMCKLQVDSVDEMFAEIEAMRQNGWREILRTPTAPSSRRSSASSSPKSGSQSQASTPSATPGHTPGSRRKNLGKPKDTPESSPEHEKARQVAKARDEARKKMLAEKRAALKQQNQQAAQDVEIFLPEGGKT